MPGKTRLVTINSIAPTQIVVASFTRQIVFCEDQSVPRWPTTGFTVAKPTAGDQPKTVGPGQEYICTRTGGIYAPGDTACYIAAISGSTTLSIDEQDSV